MTNLSKKTATSVRHDNGAIICRYHNTDIVKVEAGTVTLNSGGWRTVTTKRRMNQCFEEWGIPLRIFQSNFEWYIQQEGAARSHPFLENMTITFKAHQFLFNR